MATPADALWGRGARTASRWSSTTRLRTALLGLCAFAIAGAALLGDPVPLLRADPELATLLRGMAALKAVMVIAALAVLWWRFGWPVPPRTTAVYLVAAALLAGATTLVWQLSALLAASAVLHAAALTMLITASREKR